MIDAAITVRCWASVSVGRAAGKDHPRTPRALTTDGQRLVAVIPARDADQLAAALEGAVERGVALDLIVSDGAVLDLPKSDRVRVSRRAGSMPEDERLAVVVGDGEETVLADLGQDRPQGMWTHHPAVALLAEAHVRTHD